MKNIKDTIASLESIIATLATRIEELGEDLGDHLSAADLAITIECQPEPEEEEPEFSTIAQCQAWRRGERPRAYTADEIEALSEDAWDARRDQARED